MLSDERKLLRNSQTNCNYICIYIYIDIIYMLLRVEGWECITGDRLDFAAVINNLKSLCHKINKSLFLNHAIGENACGCPQRSRPDKALSPHILTLSPWHGEGKQQIMLLQFCSTITITNFANSSLCKTTPRPCFHHSQSIPSGSFHKPLFLLHHSADRLKTTITEK